MSQKLKVQIKKSDGELTEYDAESVSSTNSNGLFDILPGHAQMVTIIEDDYVTIRNHGEEEKISYTQALLHVHNDLVSIYVPD